MPAGCFGPKCRNSPLLSLNPRRWSQPERPLCILFCEPGVTWHRLRQAGSFCRPSAARGTPMQNTRSSWGPARAVAERGDFRGQGCPTRSTPAPLARADSAAVQPHFEHRDPAVRCQPRSQAPPRPCHLNCKCSLLDMGGKGVMVWLTHGDNVHIPVPEKWPQHSLHGALAARREAGLCRRRGCSGKPACGIIHMD